MMNTPCPDSPSADDDQHWLDLMAGRAVDDAHGATRREAAWLRAALLSYRAEAPSGAPSPAGPRADRLVARAREVGVLPPQAEAPAPPTTPAAAAQPIALPQPRRQPARHTNQPSRHGRPARRPQPAWAWALAATVAGLTVFGALRWAGLPGMPQPPGDSATSSETWRGALQLQRHSRQPQAERDRMLQQLRDAGFDAQAFERLGRPGIDLVAPASPDAGQRRWLGELGLEPGLAHSASIEFIVGDTDTEPAR